MMLKVQALFVIWCRMHAVCLYFH